MTNAIDIEPLRALAKRAGARIENVVVAKRFEAIALAQLLKDARNFRPARESDIARAPQWAKAAHARGEPLSVVRSNRAVSTRVHTVAHRLAKTCKVATADPAAREDDAAAIAAARKFLEKLGNANFDAAARRSLDFSRVLDRWDEQAEMLAVCPAQSLVLLGGRVWHRITSVAELRRVGHEFGNCLARSTRVSAYGALLANGRAQFWVLRTLNGGGLIVAMAPAPFASQFTEVKGPRNAPVRLDDDALVQLGIAIGVRPPPAPEPPPIPPGIAAAVLAARAPCRCSLCEPRLQRPLRLRRTSAAP